MLTSILLQDAAAQGNGMSTIIMIVLMIAIFYFFMIRPQNKERKRMRDFLESLQVGSKVRTASGVYGKVKEIKDTVIILEVADNVKIKIDKNYIVGSAEEATLKALVNELEELNNKGITSEATLSAVEAKVAEIDTFISGNANLALTADQQKIYNRVKSNIKVYKDSVAPAEHITANGKIWFDLKGNSRLFVKSTDEAYTNRKTYQDYLPGVDFAGFLASPTGVFAADQMSMTNLVSITDGSGGGMLVYTENANPVSPTLSTPADLKTDA